MSTEFTEQVSPEGGGVPHSRILAWESCGQRRPTGFSPWGPKSRTCLNTHTCREGLRSLTNKKLTPLSFFKDVYFKNHMQMKKTKQKENPLQIF